ncbi:Integrase [Marinobacter sp. BSs20148]|nr:Integrase [Marinobacter sp. BSs20148]
MYKAIYAQPHGELRKELIACLRQGHTKRRPRAGGVDRRQQIPDLVSIHLRPPEVEEQLLPGHWEGDLIKGAFNRSAVGTLVERVSGLVFLAKMDGATATAAVQGFSAALNRVPLEMRQTFTYDQGRVLLTRTLMACCGSTCRREQTGLCSARMSWTLLPSSSTLGLESG